MPAGDTGQPHLERVVQPAPFTANSGWGGEALLEEDLVGCANTVRDVKRSSGGHHSVDGQLGVLIEAGLWQLAAFKRAVAATSSRGKDGDLFATIATSVRVVHGGEAISVATVHECRVGRCADSR